MNILLQPWPWYVAGPLIALTLTILLFLGRNFGMSSNLRTLCSLAGAGRACAFFRFDYRSQLWNLVFAAGAVGGGLLMTLLGSEAGTVALNAEVATHLQNLGIDTDASVAPAAIYGSSGSWPGALGLSALIAGGFLIGFGARWAGGCTSGHAISGLSSLQKGSLIAVIGFFIGGLFMTWIAFPRLATLMGTITGT
jgi:uncharacterized protein